LVALKLVSVALYRQKISLTHRSINHVATIQSGVHRGWLRKDSVRV
jgi:hypothetical protein